MGLHSSDRPLDALETLLARVLAELEEGADLEEVLERYPDESEGLRRRLSKLGPLGMGGGFALRAPSQIGEWRLESLLGSGGMGEVWRAVRESDGQLAALKIVRSATLGPKHTKRFEREAAALAALDHPGIVRLLDVGEADGYRYLAMELLDGRSLAELLRDGPRPRVPAIVRWGRDLARALAAAHASGVVHRDVKPSNIQITPDGRAVLIDFGLTRGVGPSSLSITGRFVGSPHYAAPEQVRGSTDGVGPAADIYSLGVTMYEAVSGSLPFEGRSAEELFHNILTQEPTPLGRRGPGLPADLATVIECALEKRPEERHGSAERFAEDLEAVIELRPVSAQRPGLARRALRLARRRRALASGLVVLLVVSLVFGGAWVADRRSKRVKRVEEARSNLLEVEQLFERFLHEERDLPEKLVEYAWKLPQLEAAPYSREATRELDQLQREIEETETLRERVFTDAMEKLRLAEDLEPGLEPDVNRLRARIYLERWRHARTSGDRAMGSLYADRVREYDPDGSFAAAVDPIRRVTVTTTPPGARVDAFVYRRQDEFAADGEPRLVPVPVAGAPQGPLPGTRALVVRTAEEPLHPGDVIFETDGVPVGEAVFARGQDGSVARVLSVGGMPVVDVGQAEDAVDTNAGTSAVELVHGEHEPATVPAATLAFLSPREAAEAGGLSARVWRDGRWFDVELSRGSSLRPTAAPLLHGPESLVGVSPVQEAAIAGGELILLLRKEGFVPRRIPLPPGTDRVEVTLDPIGRFPTPFLRTTSRPEEMIVMDREVTQAEYAAFLAARPEHGLPPGWTRDASSAPHLPPGTTEDYAVHTITFDDALEYAQWRTEEARAQGHSWSFGLPDAKRWLALVQADTSKRRFVWGADFRPHYAKTCFSRLRPRAEPVLRFPIDETIHGLFDTAGGVAEFCSGWFWPERRQHSVYGGSWVNADPERFEVNYLWGAREAGAFEFVGFRLELIE